jgi:hypothetical protein
MLERRLTHIRWIGFLRTLATVSAEFVLIVAGTLFPPPPLPTWSIGHL